MIKRALSMFLTVALMFTMALNIGIPVSAETLNVGEKIALLALSNNNYICAENSGTNPLIANKTTHGLLEEFIVADAGSGLYALQATANNKYVSVQANNQLIASATSIGANEKFQIIDAGGSNINIKANVNGKFVCADISTTLPVTADRTTAGEWEVFQKVLVSSTQQSSEPLSRTGWTATASLNSGAAGNALDGNVSTRWDTTAVQVNGQWYTVDMKENNTFNKISLDITASPNDYPRGFQVFVSTDGTNFGSSIASGAGTSTITEITFPLQTARYIKIVQTGSAPGNYWSIHEYNIYNAIIPPAPIPLMGVTFGFTKNTLNGGPYSENNGNTIYNIPMFKATGEEALFWDNYVEEYDRAGVDFIAPTIRGYLDPDIEYPNQSGHFVNDTGDTRKLSQLVSAITRRGSSLKISCLDDTPASMTDKKNFAKHGTGGYTPLFDIGDVNGTGEGGYKYIWDNNLRVFFQTVPDSMRFKIDGRPVIYEWAIGNFAFTNQGNGNAMRMIQYIKQQAQAEFDVNPYIIVDQSWLQVDPQCASVVDGVDSWFNGNGPTWSMTTFNGKKFGALAPGFEKPNENQYTDPNHGQTLITNLTNTVNNGALVTLVEGFSDWEENCSLWRAKEGAYSVTHYDYPSQRINILRSFSNKKSLANTRIEAESADSYSDTTTGNAGGVYRDGNLDVTTCNDTIRGWCVSSIAALEWLQWNEIALSGSTSLKVRVSSATVGNRLRFEIDGVAQGWVTIPNTGSLSTWQTVDCGTYNLSEGTHTIRVYTDTGNFNFNYWINN